MKSFIFKREWYDAACQFPDEIRKEIISTLIVYAFEGKVESINPVVLSFFDFCKGQIDLSRTRSAAGSIKKNEN